MNADLSSVLSAAVDTASNAGLSDRSMARIRRGVSTRRAARTAGRAAVTVTAVGALGSVAVLAGSGRLPLVSGSGPSQTPSTSLSPSDRPQLAPIVRPTPDVEWPDEGPSWSQRMLGIDSVDVVACGTRLGDLPPSPAITMETPTFVSDTEVQTILDAVNEGYGTPVDPYETVWRETDLYTPGDDAWVAAWRVDKSKLEFAKPGAMVGLSGVDEGFAPWDAFDFAAVNMGFQVWSGFVVLDDDTVVIGRGHRANPRTGAGTLTLQDTRTISRPRYAFDAWTLTSNTAEAIEWCPNSHRDSSERVVAAVAAATTNAGITVYAWRTFPAR